MQYNDELLQEDVINFFMNEALNQAKIAVQKQEVPVGCVMTVQNEEKTQKMIAKAHNLTGEQSNATLHCEILCIDQIYEEYLDKSKYQINLFVTCEPCIMCAQAIGLIGINQVYFGCSNQRFGGNGSILNIHNGDFGAQKYLSKAGYLEQQCKDILKDFYEKGNQKLPQELRHRKKVKINTDQEQQKQ